MPVLKIVLEASEQVALHCLAKQELRDPRAQAVLLIRRGLQECGLLSVVENAAVDQDATSANEIQVRDGSIVGRTQP